MKGLSSLVSLLASGAVCVVVGGVGYVALHADVKARIYRDRLSQLGASYADLQTHYNTAVERSAVSELIVENGAVSIRTTTIDGATSTIPTSYDPSTEIYVDYVVQDGRLVVRRLFDANTRPADALVLDTGLTDIDWDTRDNTDRLAVGKAVYRSLSDGRWVVSVTGDGSLGLTRAGDADDPPARLSPGPAVSSYDQLMDDVARDFDRISPSDILRALRARLGFGGG